MASTVQRLLQDDAQQAQQAAEGGRAGVAGTGPRFRRLYLIATYGIGKERLLTGGNPRLRPQPPWLGCAGLCWAGLGR